MRYSTARFASLALLTFAAFAFTGCESKPASSDSSAASSAPAASDSATAASAAAAPSAGVSIVSPKDGDTTGTDVTVVLSKEGPVSIEKANAMKAEGVGQYHLFLDTTAVADGQVIPPATKRMVHIGTGDSSYTFKGLAPGQHEIVAVIGFGDHSAMAAKRDTVHFVVKR